MTFASEIKIQGNDISNRVRRFKKEETVVIS